LRGIGGGDSRSSTLENESRMGRDPGEEEISCGKHTTRGLRKGRGLRKFTGEKNARTALGGSPLKREANKDAASGGRAQKKQSLGSLP